MVIEAKTLALLIINLIFKRTFCTTEFSQFSPLTGKYYITDKYWIMQVTASGAGGESHGKGESVINSCITT